MLMQRCYQRCAFRRVRKKCDCTHPMEKALENVQENVLACNVTDDRICTSELKPERKFLSADACLKNVSTPMHSCNCPPECHLEHYNTRMEVAPLVTNAQKATLEVRLTTPEIQHIQLLNYSVHFTVIRSNNLRTISRAGRSHVDRH